MQRDLLLSAVDEHMKPTPGKIWGHWPGKDNAAYIATHASQRTVDTPVLLSAVGNEHISIETIGLLVDANPAAVDASVLDRALQHRRDAGVIELLANELVLTSGAIHVFNSAVLDKALQYGHGFETITILISLLTAIGDTAVVNEGVLIRALECNPPHTLATLTLLVETGNDDADAVTPAVLARALDITDDFDTIHLLAHAHLYTVDSSVLKAMFENPHAFETREMLVHASAEAEEGGAIDVDVVICALKYAPDPRTIELLLNIEPDALDAAVLVSALQTEEIDGETIKVLLASANANNKDAVDASVLRMAIEEEWDIDTLEMLVDTNKAAVDASVITAALERGCDNATISLLATGTEDTVDASVLRCALKHERDFETMQLLVDANKDDDIIAVDSHVIKRALENCEKEIIKLMVDANNPAVDTALLNTALEFGCDLDTIKLLVEANADAVDNSVLIRAATASRDSETIKLLAGANTNAVDATVLMAVMSANHNREDDATGVGQCDKCIICLDELTKPYNYRDLPCHHGNNFHKECLDNQAKIPLSFDFVMEDGEEPDSAPPSQECPLCRTPAGVEGGILKLPVHTSADIDNINTFETIRLLVGANSMSVDATVLAEAVQIGADRETLKLLTDTHNSAGNSAGKKRKAIDQDTGRLDVTDDAAKRAKLAGDAGDDRTNTGNVADRNDETQDLTRNMAESSADDDDGSDSTDDSNATQLYAETDYAELVKDGGVGIEEDTNGSSDGDGDDSAAEEEKDEEEEEELDAESEDEDGDDDDDEDGVSVTALSIPMDDSDSDSDSDSRSD